MWKEIREKVDESPSTRRAWIEIGRLLHQAHAAGVALHPEGVDRNLNSLPLCLDELQVALHPEGVDRNCQPARKGGQG